MRAQLIESDDEHHWVLLDHQVTQLLIDLRSFRLQTWSMDGSAEVRLEAPFRLRSGSGAERTLDPRTPEALAPALALLGLGLRSVTVTRAGTLTVAFGDGSTLEAVPHPRHEAWEVQGGGILEAMAYKSSDGR